MAFAVATRDEYAIQLPQFEGPLDLLLFFIERDELDIHDIPIAKLTQDFLDYMHGMETMNMDLGAEFILMASKLMKIKARMLLPRPELNEQGEVVDPRTELVDRLLEYKRYKQAVVYLQRLETLRMRQFSRAYAGTEAKTFTADSRPEDDLYGVNLYQLQKIFYNLIEKTKSRESTPKHVIQRYPYSPEQVREDVVSLVEGAGRMDFATLVRFKPERVYLVFAFLAILDMVQQKILSITIGEGYNNFWLSKRGAIQGADGQMALA